MKAITIQQPWAGLLVMGIKTCETRSWNTKHRGKIAIHASAKISDECYDLIELLKATVEDFRADTLLYETCLKTGAVLGEVEIEETFPTNVQPYIDQYISDKEKIFGDYSRDRWFYKCINPVVYHLPVPAKGQLSIWNWEKPN